MNFLGISYDITPSTYYSFGDELANGKLFSHHYNKQDYLTSSASPDPNSSSLTDYLERDAHGTITEEDDDSIDYLERERSQITDSSSISM